MIADYPPKSELCDGQKDLFFEPGAVGVFDETHAREK